MLPIVCLLEQPYLNRHRASFSTRARAGFRFPEIKFATLRPLAFG